MEVELLKEDKDISTHKTSYPLYPVYTHTHTGPITAYNTAQKTNKYGILFANQDQSNIIPTRWPETLPSHLHKDMQRKLQRPKWQPSISSVPYKHFH